MKIPTENYLELAAAVIQKAAEDLVNYKFLLNKNYDELKEIEIEYEVVKKQTRSTF